MVPTVGATELAITSVSSVTTCGSAADSEDRKNRLTPSTASTPTYSGSPRLPEATRKAVRATKTARTSADQTRICRRDQRSMNTPANGPTSEYGRYKTAKAAAAAPGSGKVVALKNTYAPSPAVNMPSPACEISLVANRRRKFRSARMARRSARNECWPADRRPGRRLLLMAGRRGGIGAGSGRAPGQTIRHGSSACGAAASAVRIPAPMGGGSLNQIGIRPRGSRGAIRIQRRPGRAGLRVSGRRLLGSTRPGRTGPGPPGRW